ncbi:MAG: hypothetical protein WBX01_00155 [Nitrososphaeraceae archaeon]
MSHNKNTDEMKLELNDFANSITAEAEEELRNEFDKHVKAARQFKESGNIQLMVEFYSKALAIQIFLDVMKK